MKEEAELIVVDELEALKERIIDNIRASGQIASGQTIDSLKVIADDDSVALWGRAAFGVLETGRGKGSVPFGFRGIILQWMEDKGISGVPMPYIRKPSDRWQPKYDSPQERGNATMAAAIAAVIARDGSKLHRSGEKHDIYSNEIPTTLKNIRERLKGVLVMEVKNVIKLN